MELNNSDTLFYQHTEPFQLQSGEILPGFRLAYNLYGQPDKPVLWIFHALTGSSRIQEWWENILSPVGPIDPDKWCIVCANMLGSCYGSSGPSNLLPGEEQPRYWEFPDLTIHDQVKAFDLLRTHLRLNKIQLAIGSSMGGQNLLEWATWKPEIFEKLIIVASNASHSPMGRAFNAAQRIAIEVDSEFGKPYNNAGAVGMAAARAIAMISYRSYADFKNKSNNAGINQNEESYLKHIGRRIKERFNPCSYYLLSKTMDSHEVGKSIGLSAEEALKRVDADSLIISIDSDILFPPAEQRFLAANLKNSTLIELHSPFGHDAFLVEFELLNNHFKKFIHEKN